MSLTRLGYEVAVASDLGTRSDLPHLDKVRCCEPPCVVRGTCHSPVALQEPDPVSNCVSELRVRSSQKTSALADS